MLISSRFEVVGMAERSNLRNQPQNGDSISLVENEAIRTTSLVTNDQIDALSYITMQQIQQPSNEDYIFLHELDETVIELEPRFSGFWNGIVSKDDGPFYPHNIPQCSEGLEMGLSCDRRAQCRNVPSLQNSIDGKKRKMSYDDESQPTASEDANDAYEEDKVSEKQDEENSQLKHIHLSNSEASVILTRFSAEALEEDRGLMRAKRGEAMSRHSLAERNRRERISERMKFLQGLVPGCDKITGKAVMLDEIINYVVFIATPG